MPANIRGDCCDSLVFGGSASLSLRGCFIFYVGLPTYEHLASRRIKLYYEKSSTELPTAYQQTMHKYGIGQIVYFEGTFGYSAARGQYTIVGLVPVEKDNKVAYRIKNPAEAFERVAEEHQLTSS